MVYIAHGSLGQQRQIPSDVTNKEFDYSYPTGMNLKPGSELHDKIKSEVYKRCLHSANIMSRRYPAWREIDRTLTAYIEPDDEEQEVKADDERKPVSIVVPESYSVMETTLSYLIAAYFQNPLFMYEGASPEDTLGAIMMEKVIEVHTHRSKVLLNLHTHFRDGLSYGLGAAAPSWLVDRGYKTVAQPTGFFSTIKNKFVEQGISKGKEEVILYEGNELVNIDPYLTLPDVNVPIQDVQKGEYFGWVEKTNYMDLLTEEKNDDDVFNVRYLGMLGNKKTSIFAIDQSGRHDRIGTEIVQDTVYTQPTDVLNLVIKIIPREWKLGDNEYPEKWHFQVGADLIVLKAKPLGLNHDKFPIVINSPDFDGYSSTPISRMEMLHGMQGVLDWLFNAHIANVRKAINDMVVYDPYLLNSKDIESPKPGKHIRVRRPGWGRGVKDSIMQLQISDITRGHVADAGIVTSLMQRIGAADDAAQGQMRQGGPDRLTKAEFQGTSRGHATRLERVARVIGVQSIQDIGYFFAHHAQQLMSEELYVKTTGRWQQTLMEEYGSKVKGNRMKVSPYDLLIDFDLFMRDGSIPDGNFSEVWVRMFESLIKVPELNQYFDITRIFKHIARNAGGKNVDEFVRVKKVPNEEALEEVDKGNLVTLDQQIGAAT